MHLPLQSRFKAFCGSIHVVVVVVVVDVVVVVCLFWHSSAAYELIVPSSLVLLHLQQNS